VDPNITLDKLRELCREAIDSEASKSHPMQNNAADPVDIAELFEAIDQWLSNGGFLPSEWQPRDTLPGVP